MAARFLESAPAMSCVYPDGKQRRCEANGLTAQFRHNVVSSRAETSKPSTSDRSQDASLRAITIHAAKTVDGEGRGEPGGQARENGALCVPQRYSNSCLPEILGDRGGGGCELKACVGELLRRMKADKDKIKSQDEKAESQ